MCPHWGHTNYFSPIRNLASAEDPLWFKSRMPLTRPCPHPSLRSRQRQGQFYNNTSLMNHMRIAMLTLNTQIIPKRLPENPRGLTSSDSSGMPFRYKRRATIGVVVFFGPQAGRRVHCNSCFRDDDRQTVIRASICKLFAGSKALRPRSRDGMIPGICI